MSDLDLTVVDPNLLPPQMRQLVRVIGLPETLLLLQARGGTFLRVPIYPEFARVLSAIVNEYSVRALCAAFGDQTLELPKCDKIIRQLRDHAIRIERQRRSCAAVARDYNLTRRQVINITHDIDDGQQPDMFS